MNTIGQMNMGMSVKKGKGSTHRGRKPSMKPGASHLSALTIAHGKGDFAAAKTAAFNYGNAVHKHMTGLAATQNTADASDMDADDAYGDTPTPTPTLGATPIATPSGGATSLAHAAMIKRMKK